MLKISEDLANKLSENNKIGFINDFGSMIGDSEFIVYQNDKDEWFLLHSSELEWNGIFFKIKGEHE